ncbi:uncharacterized protein LOC129948110 [Eupeodes corollae]|uniref:uncharacterized protein LOC129948110 n=1 Tax=Eupeodes corollae TaxID=290404 RepID=UPI00248FAD11|nr:uncharacterized protein LOC129948110 [Eupeodes corollae]
MSKVLKDLTVPELKAELSKRGLSGIEVKTELVKRFQEYLEQQNEAKVEEVNSNVALSNMVSILLAKFKENKNDVLKQLEAQRSDQKLEQQNVLKQLETHRTEEKIKTVDERVEKQNARFEKIDEQIETITNELEKVRKMKAREPSGECSRKREVNPPSFDGQIPWSIYKKQFEAAALTNGWDDHEKYIALTLALRGSAAELLQTIPADKSDDFTVLVNAMEQWFGDSHMIEVFRVQLNNRTQKRGETLQQLQADIERLVHLVYPTAGNEIINKLAVEAFVRAVGDIYLQRAIRTAGKRTLPEALAFALTMEAAEQASQNVNRVRKIEVQECSCQKATVQRS